MSAYNTGTRQRVQIFGETIAGKIIPFLLGDDGEVLQSAYFDNIIIEAPGVNTKYAQISGTINNGLSNQAVNMGDVTTGYAFEIINKTTDTILKLKLNGTGNAEIHIVNNFTLGTIGLEFNNMKFTSMHLTNDSGSNIDYDIKIIGV
jgi:hypothetical protein